MMLISKSNRTQKPKEVHFTFDYLPKVDIWLCVYVCQIKLIDTQIYHIMYVALRVKVVTGKYQKKATLLIK